MGTERAPLQDFAPRSKAAEAYRSLWDEVQEKLTAPLQRR